MDDNDLFAALVKKYKVDVKQGGTHLQIETIMGGKYRAFFGTGKFVHCSTQGAHPNANAALEALAMRAGVVARQPSV